MIVKQEYTPIALKALEEINEKIIKLEKQEYLIHNLDTTVPVTEEEWHKICETPLRTTNIMIDILKSTFPDAENIKINEDYMNFYLYGIKCALPITSSNYISVDVDFININMETKLKIINDRQKIIDAIEAKLINLAMNVIPELEKFTSDIRFLKSGMSLNKNEIKENWSIIYSIVAYDKDGGTYSILQDNLYYKKAIDIAEKLCEDLGNGLLKSENGEPYDWIEVYKNYNSIMEKEEIVWSSYEKEEQYINIEEERG